MWLVKLLSLFGSGAAVQRLTCTFEALSRGDAAGDDAERLRPSADCALSSDGERDVWPSDEPRRDLWSAVLTLSFRLSAISAAVIDKDLSSRRFSLSAHLCRGPFSLSVASVTQCGADALTITSSWWQWTETERYKM